MGETRKFRITVSNGLVGCTVEEVIEIPADEVPEDPITDPEFNDMMRDEMFNLIEWGFVEVTDQESGQ